MLFCQISYLKCSAFLCFLTKIEKDKKGGLMEGLFYYYLIGFVPFFAWMWKEDGLGCALLIFLPVTPFAIVLIGLPLLWPIILIINYKKVKEEFWIIYAKILPIH